MLLTQRSTLPQKIDMLAIQIGMLLQVKYQMFHLHNLLLQD